MIPSRDSRAVKERQDTDLAAIPRMPRSVWALGFVSMFMDISSEMIHSLLPVFLVTVLGGSAVTVGLIEGVGEATASFSKPSSATVSARYPSRCLRWP